MLKDKSLILASTQTKKNFVHETLGMRKKITALLMGQKKPLS